MTNAYQPGVIPSLVAWTGADNQPDLQQINLSFLTALKNLPTLLMNFQATSLVPVLTLSLAFTLPSTSPVSLEANFQAQTYAAGTPNPGVYGASGQPTPGAIQAGAPDYEGVYTIGDYSLALPVELKLSFLEAQSPPLPAGFSGQSLLLDFLDQYFVAQNYPPSGSLFMGFSTPLSQQTLAVNFITAVYDAGSPPSIFGTYLSQPAADVPSGGTPVLPDPAYAIGFVTPGTSDDSRVGPLVIGYTNV